MLLNERENQKHALPSKEMMPRLQQQKHQVHLFGKGCQPVGKGRHYQINYYILIDATIGADFKVSNLKEIILFIVVLEAVFMHHESHKKSVFTEHQVFRNGK